jgi:hypothetical protein
MTEQNITHNKLERREMRWGNEEGKGRFILPTCLLSTHRAGGKSIFTGGHDSGSDSYLGNGVDFGLTSMYHKKCQRSFKPNRSARNPVSTPLQRTLIGLAPNAIGGLADGAALAVTGGDWSH